MANYLITGASTGLGRGLSRELCARGHQVWGVSRHREKLVELERELGNTRFIFSVCDVGQEGDILQTVQAMEHRRFSPDVVILNAGINPERQGAPFLLKQFQEVLKVNLFGALAWVEVFLPVFSARGKGQFVAISSLAAYRGDARWVAYSASKSALDRAFEAFGARHAGEGVVFTTIHLGAVNVGMGLGSRSPFTLTEEKAVAGILGAIERRVACITIPRYLRLFLELTRVLPDPLFSRLAVGALRFTPKSGSNNH